MNIKIPEDYESQKHLKMAKLAAKFMGIKECQFWYLCLPGKKMYQIIPVPTPPSTAFEKINLWAFRSYFVNTYGSKAPHKCIFETPHEAFFYLLKAWDKWSNSLSQEEKEPFLEKQKIWNYKDDTEEDVRNWELSKNM